MNAPHRPRIREDLLFRQVDEDFVVYDPVADRSAMLNASAAAVFALCDGTYTVEEITGEVARIFSQEGAAVRIDVENALGMFRSERFIETEAI